MLCCCILGLQVTNSNDIQSVELDSADDDMLYTMPSSREMTDSSELTLTSTSHGCQLSQVSDDDDDDKTVTTGN